jgi:hypothetical protein
MILAYKNRKKVKSFADGCHATWSDLEAIQTNTQWPMILSGITTMAPIDQARKHGLDYWYIDTGYLGNHKRKSYLRVCKNSIHASGDIIARPRDRLDRLQVDTTRIARGGSVLIIPPDTKQASHFDIGDVDIWLADTVARIQDLTDRPIQIRHRPASRTTRMASDTLVQALAQDINVVVTFISNSGVEAVLHDIPVISLGPSACVKVSPWSLDYIDAVPDIDAEVKEAWMRHLSYCQFTQHEMRTGQAWKILNPG